MPSSKIETHAQLALRDATEWIESTRDQIRALSEATLLLSAKDERTLKGIRDLWGAIDAQLVTTIGHIQEGRAAL